MKYATAILSVLVMLGAVYVSGQDEPYDVPQIWSETKSSAPKKLILEPASKPEFNLATKEWYFRVQALDVKDMPVGIKRNGNWIPAGNAIKIYAPMADIETLFGQVTGATMHVKLQKALRKYAVQVLSP